MHLQDTIIHRVYNRAIGPVLSRTWASRLGMQPWYACATERLHNHFTGHHHPGWTPAGVEFVHVPKSGGTSVRAILDTLGHPNPNLHRPMPPPVVRRLIDGREPRARYVTVLRDPIDRVWSLFWMAKEGGPWQGIASDLRSFLSASWEARNEYVQYLTGAPRSDPGARELEAAKRVLARFWFVLEFDRFEQDAKRLAAVLGDPDVRVPRVNADRRYREPTSDEVAMIADNNRSDLALYEWWRAARQ